MKHLAIVSFVAAWLAGCATGGASSNSAGGESSQPINAKEDVEYKQSLLRCYKTGGSRIVKINGILRCF